MKYDDIVTVVTPTGEYIGKLENQNGDKITLSKPMTVIASQQGLDFAPVLAMTGKPTPSSVTLWNVVLVTETDDEVSDRYKQHVGSLITPNSSKLLV